MEILKVFKIVPEENKKANNVILHIVLNKVTIENNTVTDILPWFDTIKVRICCNDLNIYDMITSINIKDMYSSDYVVMSKVVFAITSEITKKHGGTIMSNGDILL